MFVPTGGRRRAMATLCLIAVSCIMPSRNTATVHAANGDWPMYLGDSGRSGYNSGESIINPATVGRLSLQWTAQAPQAVTTQPIVTNGMVYWGSWDGYERATDLTGHAVWSQFLGTAKNQCGYNVGVADSPVVTTVTIGGQSRTVLFISSVTGKLFALDANTGTIIWQTVLAPQGSGWASPAFYNGSVYVGMSCGGSFVQSQLVRVDAATGAIQDRFLVAPAGCPGSGIWGSPTIDEATGILYFATGDALRCTNEPYGESIVALNSADLSYVSSWQIPAAQMIYDGDFGSTPTLFSATIGGINHSMLGIAAKNGIYYALDRSNLAAGPLWFDRIAMAGSGPDNLGEGILSPSAWDGSNLYVAGGVTLIGTIVCSGSVWKLDPATGKSLWHTCLSTTSSLAPAGAVIGAVTVVPGLVVVGSGDQMMVLFTATGQTAWTYTASSGQPFYAAATIVNGVLYDADNHGTLYAFGTTTGPNIDAVLPGPCTNTVPISGYSFGASETVNVYWDSTTNPVIASATTDSSGSFGTSFVLAPQPLGSHTLIAVGQSSGLQASEAYPITPRTCLLHALALPLSKNVLSGSGFAPGEVVAVSVNKLPIGQVTTDATGSFSGAAALKFSSPGGRYQPQTITSVGQSSGASAVSRYLIPAQERLSTTRGSPGTVVTVSGTDFNDLWTVTVLGNCATSPCPQGTVLATAQTDVQGSFSNLAVTIPATPAGSYPIGTQGTFGIFAFAPFTIVPGVSITPSSGVRGSTAAVAGQGYLANAGITVYWNCKIGPCTGHPVLGTTTTDSTGSFSGLSATIPLGASVGNTYPVAAVSGNYSASTSFTVTG